MHRPTKIAFLLNLLFCCQFVSAHEGPITAALTNPNSQSGAEAPSGSTDIPLDDNREKVRLVIRVRVPQNRRANNQFTVYPYPVEPPLAHPKLAVSLLSTKDKDLKSALLALGYTARVKKQLPYITCGYRMNYAYQRALKNFGGGQPHTIGEVYRWVDEMVPYFRTEVLKSNEDERTRGERLAAAKTVYYTERNDIETEALKQGLSPEELRVGSWEGPGQRGEIALAKGHWWIVGTHKLLGLTYYWQEPVDLTNGGQVVELNDGNALLMEGGW